MLANVILIVHFLYVSFVLGGFILIWIGYWAHWSWVRHRTFRLLHVGSIGLVAAEAVFGVTCPLTVLEDALRPESYGSGFIEYWLHQLLFYTAPAHVFTAIYLAFFSLVVLTWFLVKPNPRRKKPRSSV